MTDDTPSDGGDSTTDAEQFELTASERERADIQMRYALANALGDFQGTEKDKYEVFGWDKNPDVEDYYASYLRNAYARAVCDQPVETTWRDAPDVADKAEHDEGDETAFEAALDAVLDETRLWHYTKRGDILSGIGQYGVLVLEFDDISSPTDFDSEVSAASALNGLRPFSQASVEEIELGGPGSDRWGEPVRYKLDLGDENDEVSQQGPAELWVHHSRVVHIPSDGLLDDEVRGTPRQEPIWNNLTDIEKALGSAGELAYRASAWGLNVNLDGDYRLEDDGDAMSEHLQRWYYGLEPILKTQGAQDVQSLGGESIDPQPIIDANVAAISSQVGIPQSVLKGNEAGDMATTQDLKEWYGQIQSRRKEFVNPMIVRAIIDRLLDVGVLPPPRGEGYTVDWRPLAESDPKEIAEIEHLRVETLDTWPGYMEERLSANQQLEYVKEGTLPSELDESELAPPDMDIGQEGTDPFAENAEAPLPDELAQQQAATDGGMDEDAE